MSGKDNNIIKKIIIKKKVREINKKINNNLKEIFDYNTIWILIFFIILFVISFMSIYICIINKRETKLYDIFSKIIPASSVSGFLALSLAFYNIGVSKRKIKKDNAYDIISDYIKDINNLIEKNKKEINSFIVADHKSTKQAIVTLHEKSLNLYFELIIKTKDIKNKLSYIDTSFSKIEKYIDEMIEDLSNDKLLDIDSITRDNTVDNAIKIFNSFKNSNEVRNNSISYCLNDFKEYFILDCLYRFLEY